MKRYPDCLFAQHAKDNEGIGVRDDERNFEGLLDMDEIVATAHEEPRPLYIVEYDLPKDPAANIKASKLRLQRALMHRRSR